MLNLSFILKLPLLQKLKENFLKLKILLINQLKSQSFNLIEERIEDLVEPYQANNFEFSDFKCPKKVLDGYHAAIFSCAVLRLSLETLQQSSVEIQSTVCLLNGVFTINLPSKFSLDFEIFLYK